jgi:hypothetical protein
MNKKVLLVLVLGLVMSFPLVSCRSISKPYFVKVIQNQQLIKSYRLDDIKKMPVHSFVKDGIIESGPTLAYLLEDAGIKSFTSITLKNAKGEFYKIQSSMGEIIDITNRGSIKLASENIAKNKWLKDIIEISVETLP